MTTNHWYLVTSATEHVTTDPPYFQRLRYGLLHQSHPDSDK